MEAKHTAALAQPPFTLRAQLEDADWIAARRQALEAEIAPLEWQRDQYEKHLQKLMALSGSHSHYAAAGFGPN